jgi:hypothetical protein
VVDLLRLGRLPEAYIAPVQLRELRELVRHRHTLVQVRTTQKASLHAVLGKCGVIPTALFACWSTHQNKQPTGSAEGRESCSSTPRQSSPTNYKASTVVFARPRLRTTHCAPWMRWLARLHNGSMTHWRGLMAHLWRELSFGVDPMPIPTLLTCKLPPGRSQRRQIGGAVLSCGAIMP